MLRMVVIGPASFRTMLTEDIGEPVQLPCEFENVESALRFWGSHCDLVVGADLDFLDAQRLRLHFSQDGTTRVVRIRMNEDTLDREGDPSEEGLGITTCELAEAPALLLRIGS